MLEAGDIIGRDLARARALYDKTCAGGIAADCYALGRLVQRDPAGRKAAFDLFGKGCAGNVAAACHEVALAWDAGREPMKALPFYQKACAGGVAAACQRAKRLQP
jgi:TPR repeat protein